MASFSNQSKLYIRHIISQLIKFISTVTAIFLFIIIVIINRNSAGLYIIAHCSRSLTQIRYLLIPRGYLIHYDIFIIPLYESLNVVKFNSSTLPAIIINHNGNMIVKV